MTDSAEIFDRSVMMSSLMPSLKYSCSASPLMLTKGRTQTDSLRDGADGAAAALLPLSCDGAPASSAMLASTLHQPWDVVSPAQLDRSAHWIWLNGIGGI